MRRDPRTRLPTAYEVCSGAHVLATTLSFAEALQMSVEMRTEASAAGASLATDGQEAVARDEDFVPEGFRQAWKMVPVWYECPVLHQSPQKSQRGRPFKRPGHEVRATGLFSNSLPVSNKYQRMLADESGLAAGTRDSFASLTQGGPEAALSTSVGR